MQKKPGGQLRLFVALELPGSLHTYLDAVCSAMRASIGHSKNIRWSKQANRHLTMCFLGETEPGLLPGLCGELDAIASQHDCFGGEIFRVCSFPDAKSPIIAAELESNPDMERLHMDCGRLLSLVGRPPERRRFRPHITLARCRRRLREPPLLPAAQNVHFDQLVLVASELTPGGSIYTPIERWPLGPATPN